MSETTNKHLPATVEGITTRRSAFSVADTLERLQSAMRAHNLTLFAHIDHGGVAQQAGLVMQPAHVLIFGNPQAGTPLMVASPLLALDLPLKALVWQSDDGSVWVSSTSPAYLQGRYAIPAALVGNIAGADTLIAQTLRG